MVAAIASVAAATASVAAAAATLGLCPVSGPPEGVPAPEATAWVIIAEPAHVPVAGVNACEPRPPASLTKLATAIATRQLDSRTVHTVDSFEPPGGHQIGISVGEQVNVGDLRRWTLVDSANDAAVVLAETGDVEPATLNRLAGRLGLTDTHFVNVTGMPDEGHVSSPMDMALLLDAAYADDVLRMLLGERASEPVNGDGAVAWFGPSITRLAVKTGYTAAAGHTLAVKAASAVGTFDVVLFDTPDGADDFYRAAVLYMFLWGSRQLPETCPSVGLCGT